MKKIRISLSDKDYDIFKTLSDNSEDEDRGDIRKTIFIMAQCGYYALSQKMIDTSQVIDRPNLFNGKCFFCGQNTEYHTCIFKGNKFWICKDCKDELNSPV